MMARCLTFIAAMSALVQVLAHHRLKVEQRHSKGGDRPARVLQGKRAMGSPPPLLQLLASWGLAVSQATSASDCQVINFLL